MEIKKSGKGPHFFFSGFWLEILFVQVTERLWDQITYLKTLLTITCYHLNYCYLDSNVKWLCLFIPSFRPTLLYEETGSFLCRVCLKAENWNWGLLFKEQPECPKLNKIKSIQGHQAACKEQCHCSSQLLGQVENMSYCRTGKIWFSFMEHKRIIFFFY